MADTYGHTDVVRGRIDGNLLLIEGIGHAPMRLRPVWDATDPADIFWRNEMSVGGAPCLLVEDYHMTPV
jgi:hypothetical protein